MRGRLRGGPGERVPGRRARARRLELAARWGKGGQSEEPGDSRLRAPLPLFLPRALRLVAAPAPPARPFPPVGACDWLEGSDVRISMTCRCGEGGGGGGGWGGSGARGSDSVSHSCSFGAGPGCSRDLWRQESHDCRRSSADALHLGPSPSTPRACAPLGPGTWAGGRERASAPGEDRLSRTPVSGSSPRLCAPCTLDLLPVPGRDARAGRPSASPLARSLRREPTPPKGARHPICSCFPGPQIPGIHAAAPKGLLRRLVDARRPRKICA